MKARFSHTDSREEPGEKGLFLSIVLAFVLWFIIFILRPFNFWLMLSFSTSLLGAISFALVRPLIPKGEWCLKNILLGLILAGLLYGIFWAGNQFLIFLSGLFSALLPDRSGSIGAVYANLGSLSPALAGVLLFFPIGFGEEVFWRGFIQRRLSRKWNRNMGFLLTLFLYTGIHLPTANPVLILAAFTCGAFWGGCYWATGRLVPVLVSHMLWDPAIFVIWPIK
jgi:membrane protease YdiL (CAAX protease family)